MNRIENDKIMESEEKVSIKQYYSRFCQLFEFLLTGRVYLNLWGIYHSLWVPINGESTVLYQSDKSNKGKGITGKILLVDRVTTSSGCAYWQKGWHDQRIWKEWRKRARVMRKDHRPVQTGSKGRTEKALCWRSLF